MTRPSQPLVAWPRKGFMGEDYASSAPSLGSSAASTFERRRMLEAWISAMVYLTC